MEWIRINSNKLKIMLTAADAKRYSLSPDADHADDVTRRAFRAILTDMKSEADFDATDDKLYIQMYPSREGGCELFVTKMGVSLQGGEEYMEQRLSKKETKPFAPRERRLAFCFGGVQLLLAVCERLAARCYVGKSRAWQDDEGRYWLLLIDKGDPLAARRDYGFVAEYGAFESAECAELMLSEHGKLICDKNAVETLGNL